MQNSVIIGLLISACFGIGMVSPRRYRTTEADYSTSVEDYESDYDDNEYESYEYDKVVGNLEGGNGYNGGYVFRSVKRGNSPRVSYRSCKGPFQKCYRHDECCSQYCKGKLSKAKKCTG